MRYEVDIAGRLCQVIVRRTDDTFVVSVDGREWMVDAARVDGATLSLCLATAGLAGSGGQATNAAAGRILSREVTLAADGPSGQTRVSVGARPVQVSLNGRRRWGRGETGGPSGTGPQRLTAPMPGKIVRLLVKAGDVVAARQPIVVVEAMKMENELGAPGAGRVTDLHVREGQLVDAGAVLAVINAS